jgi:hypothetical protein
MHEEINRRFNVINAKEHSVQNPVLSSLLSKYSKIKRNVNLPAVFVHAKFLTLREEHK